MIEVKVSFFGHQVDAVWIHDKRHILVDEFNGEHVTMVTSDAVQEVDSVTRKLDRSQSATNHFRFPMSTVQNRKVKALSFIILLCCLYK